MPLIWSFHDVTPFSFLPVLHQKAGDGFTEGRVVALKDPSANHRDRPTEGRTEDWGEETLIVFWSLIGSTLNLSDGVQWTNETTEWVQLVAKGSANHWMIRMIRIKISWFQLVFFFTSINYLYVFDCWLDKTSKLSSSPLALRHVCKKFNIKNPPDSSQSEYPSKFRHNVFLACWSIVASVLVCTFKSPCHFQTSTQSR